MGGADGRIVQPCDSCFLHVLIAFEEWNMGGIMGERQVLVGCGRIWKVARIARQLRETKQSFII